MPFFADEDEVHRYVGGMFERARETEVGPKLAAADLDLQIVYTDPEAKTLVRMRGENITVHSGEDDPAATIRLSLPADLADKYWRGDLNLAVALARGQAKAKGPVNKLLKLVPLTKPLFPLYRDLVAEKDAATPAA